MGCVYSRVENIVSKRINAGNQKFKCSFSHVFKNPSYYWRLESGLCCK